MLIDKACMGKFQQCSSIIGLHEPRFQNSNNARKDEERFNWTDGTGMPTTLA